MRQGPVAAGPAAAAGRQLPVRRQVRVAVHLPHLRVVRVCGGALRVLHPGESRFEDGDTWQGAHRFERCREATECKGGVVGKGTGMRGCNSQALSAVLMNPPGVTQR